MANAEKLTTETVMVDATAAAMTGDETTVITDTTMRDLIMAVRITAADTMSRTTTQATTTTMILTVAEGDLDDVGPTQTTIPARAAPDTIAIPAHMNAGRCTPIPIFAEIGPFL